MTKNPSTEVNFEIIIASDIDALAEYLRNEYADIFEARGVVESLIDKLRRREYFGEEEAYLNITIRRSLKRR